MLSDFMKLRNENIIIIGKIKILKTQLKGAKKNENPEYTN